jgi:hypothetical protein
MPPVGKAGEGKGQDGSALKAVEFKLEPTMTKAEIRNLIWDSIAKATVPIEYRHLLQ